MLLGSNLNVILLHFHPSFKKTESHLEYMCIDDQLQGLDNKF